MSGASAAAAIGGSVIQGGIDYLVSDQLAERQMSRNMMLQDMQNKYNSPENQVERLNRAGLSPNLMYGQVSPGNQTSPVAYNAPAFSASRMLDQVAMMSKVANDNKLAQAQVENIESKTQVNRQLMQLTQNKSSSTEMANIVYQGLYGISYDDANNPSIVDPSSLKSLVTELQNRGTLSNDQHDLNNAKLSTLSAQVGNYESQIDLRTKQGDYLESGKALRDLEFLMKQLDYNFYSPRGGKASYDNTNIDIKDIANSIIKILSLLK